MLISSTYLTTPKIKIPALWNSENGNAWPVKKKSDLVKACHCPGKYDKSTVSEDARYLFLIRETCTQMFDNKPYLKNLST
jgi:hypothetical protein